MSIADQIALRTQDMREDFARPVRRVFLWANGVTLLGLAGLVGLDQFNLWHGVTEAGDRIVNSNVVMALLGATTVQVGAISAIIARHLFPVQR